MHTTLNISEAAGLAVHAVSIIAKSGGQNPVKLSSLASMMNASVAHLGKVMHRLALAGVVTSKRGPSGGFTLGRRAGTMTLLDVQELFDGPLTCKRCLLGHESCPFGECLLGNTVDEVNAVVRRELGKKKIRDL
jgi:Rrf2 family protein